MTYHLCFSFPSYVMINNTYFLHKIFANIIENFAAFTGPLLSSQKCVEIVY